MLDIMKRAFGENTDTPIMSRRQAFAGAALPLAAMTVSNPAMAASGPMGDSFSVPKGRIESRQMTFTDNVAKLNAEMRLYRALTDEANSIDSSTLIVDAASTVIASIIRVCPVSRSIAP